LNLYFFEKTKIESKSVQTGRFWFGSVWFLGQKLAGLVFSWFGSVFFRFGLYSFFIYFRLIKPNWTGRFFKILIGIFSRFGFFVIFIRFSRFFGFFLTPLTHNFFNYYIYIYIYIYIACLLLEDKESRKILNHCVYTI